MLRTAGYAGGVTHEAQSYPGERLGRPPAGSGSIARLGRRVGALFIDYGAAYLISGFFGWDPLAILAIFAAIQIVFIPTIQGSPGHRILGMRVVRVDGSWVGLWRPIIRTALLIVVIPAVIWDADQRGLHDKVAGTVLIRA
ncbi:RDD family protein [Microbacterium sp. zg.B48]|uniref:RDD family protein n=1 Tax=unclassified Microbacterium TaxID=2609290 RepID=UPI00214AA009|nr:MULTISPECIES: RDD family protein [unclassified Microbacterium]MCR2761928.1 RDD family protein [Microbacterium sp. zg.B48]WIM20771.1 RDD family protein [Microbacterium sp. zg-B185]